MQVPKKKSSTSKRNMRRSHHALTPRRSAVCPNCKEPIVSHSVCMSCGQYRGRQLMPVVSAE